MKTAAMTAGWASRVDLQYQNITLCESRHPATQMELGMGLSETGKYRHQQNNRDNSGTENKNDTNKTKLQAGGVSLSDQQVKLLSRLFSSSSLCTEQRGQSHVRDRAGWDIARELVSTLWLTRRRNNVLRWTVRRWQRLPIRSVGAYSVTLIETKNTGGRGKTGRGSYTRNIKREMEWLSGVVWLCGVVHCGTLWVEVQWCCHGDTLTISRGGRSSTM